MTERVVHRIRGTEAGVTAFGLYGRPTRPENARGLVGLRWNESTEGSLIRNSAAGVL